MGKFLSKKARSSGRGMAAGLLICLAAMLWERPLSAAPVAVRYSEGMVRGFLVVTTTGGVRIGSGDFLQVAGEREVQSRTLLRFKDGSLYDETAVFTQQGSFVLRSYHLIQKGPSFSEDADISLERTGGRYLVKTRSHRGDAEKVYEGRLALPRDVYNGIIPIVTKNLPQGKKETVHMVAFTPAPRLIELEVVPSGEQTVLVGDLKKSAVHYVLRPKLGWALTIPAALLGRLPPDNHLWIISADVPAFVRFQGPLQPGGPAWRIDLASPRWPE